MPTKIPSRQALRDETRFRILRLLHENPELSQRELARALGVSTGGVHYALRALVDKGLVKIGNFTAAPDKRRYAYVLTPGGIARKAALTARFLDRKLAEYDALVAEIAALRAELDAGDAEGAGA
ncbi:MAG: MarR family EPS-associated transcriptional regulator [Rubellimicrobium sp.]|nr:MarR family EPS-associated transcriptional regulator [Rubellimicrobium sp.]